MPFDLIALGETMLALAPPPGESVRSASRLLVDHAGAESNTCVGLARLGLRVAWVSRLGADAAGDRILDALGAERVDTQWVRRDATRPTGMMMKAPGAGVTYYRTGSAASEMNPDDLAGVPIADARAVLVTGVTALIGPRPHAAGLALLSAARGLRIVDPNLRRGPWGAGDAFNAGYIAVRLRGGSIEDALRAGAHCGAAVTTAVSDTSGFPRTLH